MGGALNQFFEPSVVTIVSRRKGLGPSLEAVVQEREMVWRFGAVVEKAWSQEWRMRVLVRQDSFWGWGLCGVIGWCGGLLGSWL